jgi:Holliday junction resolvase
MAWPAGACARDRMSSTYERELKGILGGEDETLRKVTKTCTPQEAAAYLRARQRPFLVVRGAGSLGVDLVALRGDVSFPIEVKSAAKDVIRFTDGSKRNHEQAVAMQRECSRASVIPLYAYRLKGKRGDSWRIHTLPTENLPPRIQVLYDRIPKVETTTEGNYVLRWENGLPLHKFLDYLCS